MFNLFNRGTPYPFESEGFRAAHDCARSGVRARRHAAFADSPRAAQTASSTSEASTFVRMLRHAARCAAYRASLALPNAFRES
jgi:hypothetical protein